MIRAGVFWVVTVLATAFYSLVSIVGGLFRARPALHDWVHRNWSRSLLWASGTTVEVHGLENVDLDNPQIFASNHQSFFDIFSLMYVLPVSIRFIAKKELERIPLFAQAMRAAGHLFIDREDRVGAMRVMRLAGERMERENLCLGLFPEGTRSPDGELQPFKRGAFVLAIETNAPIVPVAVDGGNLILGRGRGRVRPGRVKLRFGQPIDTAEVTSEDRTAVVDHVRAEVERMIASIRTGDDPDGDSAGAIDPELDPTGCPA